MIYHAGSTWLLLDFSLRPQTRPAHSSHLRFQAVTACVFRAPLEHHMALVGQGSVDQLSGPAVFLVLVADHAQLTSEILCILLIETLISTAVFDHVGLFRELHWLNSRAQGFYNSLVDTQEIVRENTLLGVCCCCCRIFLCLLRCWVVLHFFQVKYAY